MAAHQAPLSWDSPGKNTGVGCHFLLQCMKVKSESEVTQLCPTLRDPMDCSLPGSSVDGIFQARVLAAAAAKSLQSCPTLCDPIDGSLPGSPVHGILQARTLEWIAISFSNAWKWKVKGKSLSRVRLLRPHGLQPTRLLHPWDFPGKSPGVGCHWVGCHCLLH